jgi:8-oxo-dGTP pyrophosphatase MutT (NUDIX family)
MHNFTQTTEQVVHLPTFDSSIPQANINITTSEPPRHHIEIHDKTNVTCINCGFDGHTSKNCNFPITSYGIIAYYVMGATVKFITIQRKDSLSFVDFVRGKYSLHDTSYIMSLLENMTMFERKKVSSYSFHELWKDMWGAGHINTHTSHKRDYDKSYHMFAKLRKGYPFQYSNGSIEYITLQNLLLRCKNKYVDTEWEFPKGRRVLYEEDVICARREFFEETGIHSEHMLWTHPKPFEEIYTGTNHMRYRNIYYLGRYVGDPRLIRKENLGRKQKEEVRDIKWMSVHEITKALRDIYVERKEMIQRIHNVVVRVYNPYTIPIPQNQPVSSWTMDQNHDHDHYHDRNKHKNKIKRTVSSGAINVAFNSLQTDYKCNSLVVTNKQRLPKSHREFLPTPPGFPYPYFMYMPDKTCFAPNTSSRPHSHPHSHPHPHPHSHPHPPLIYPTNNIDAFISSAVPCTQSNNGYV